MKFDDIVILLVWVVSFVMLFLVVPRTRIREFLAVFLFFQTLTWIFGIVLAEFEQLEINARMFERATKLSFTTEFMLYPTIAVVFHRFFPEHRGKWRVVLHYVLCIGSILLYMYLLKTFTTIMNFKPTLLIKAFFNFTFEFWLTRRYILWLMRNTKLQNTNEVGEASEWK